MSEHHIVMEQCPATPTYGSLTFDAPIKDVAATLTQMLGDEKLHVTIQWSPTNAHTPLGIKLD